MSNTRGARRHAAVVGGGLAGMAAALALVEHGCRVELFEQKHRLGGRVGSFRDKKTGELVDYCMHVSMGCCTNFLDFIRRTKVENCFDRHRRLTFIGLEAEFCKFDSWQWLPPPLHLAPGLVRLRYLTLRERLGIGRCLMQLGRMKSGDCREMIVGEWLREQGQSERVIDRFWSVVLVSALGDTIERVALSKARQVFLDGFMRSPRGYEVLLPNRPLGEILDVRVGQYLRDIGVELRLGASVRSIELANDRAHAITTTDGTRHEFDALVLAVPWTVIGRMLSPEQCLMLLSNWNAGRIESSAITAVHLWFDREITQLSHAALVDRTSHWVFRQDQQHVRATDTVPGHHYQVVISASQHLSDMPSAELLNRVLGDLRSTWPAAASAQLLHHRIVTERNAVFSVTPEGERARPGTQTGIANVCLAGDWTDTGWPATMEGAILSGYRAARVVLGKSESKWELPVGGLKPSWLARTLFHPE